MLNHLRPVLLVLSLAALAGCQSYSSPAITVLSSEPTERTSDGVAMRFTLEATNTNEVALPLRDVEYSVELNGQHVFTGTRSAEATLRRLGTQQFFLPAVILTSQQPTPPGPAHYRISGTLTYVTPGQIAEILFDSGVRVPSVSFSGEGELNLAAPIAIPAPPKPVVAEEPQDAEPKKKPAP